MCGSCDDMRVGEGGWVDTGGDESSDVRDIGHEYGAHFIGEFAGDTPWVHLDIAATAMTDSTRGWRVEGATGVPARTLIQLALDLAGE